MRASALTHYLSSPSRNLPTELHYLLMEATVEARPHRLGRPVPFPLGPIKGELELHLSPHYYSSIPLLENLLVDTPDLELDTFYFVSMSV
jgi:hypothetical protein